MPLRNRALNSIREGAFAQRHSTMWAEAHCGHTIVTNLGLCRIFSPLPDVLSLLLLLHPLKKCSREIYGGKPKIIDHGKNSSFHVLNIAMKGNGTSMHAMVLSFVGYLNRLHQKGIYFFLD